jgi:uncharacterized membrane protein YcaP (DUF421 family)
MPETYDEANNLIWWCSRTDEAADVSKAIVTFLIIVLLLLLLLLLLLKYSDWKKFYDGSALIF